MTHRPGGPTARRRLTRLVVGFLAGVCAFAPAGSALGATAARAGSALVYVAGIGESNELVAWVVGGKMLFDDAGASVSAGPGCRSLSDTRTECVTRGVARVVLDVGDGDDSALVRTRLPLVLRGGSGDDRLVAGRGDDLVEGGPGDDTIDGGFGADAIRGGDGVDRVLYWTRQSPVRVTLDARGDDGASGELDNVFPDIEDVSGGAGDDVLVGNDEANVLNGNAGDDIHEGRRGNDLLDGGPGADFMRGGEGVDAVSYASRTRGVRVGPDGIANDGAPGERDNVLPDVENLAGSEGDDVLRGTSGANRLNGKRGRDILVGRGGADSFNALDKGRDTVFCGDGTEFVTADAVDRLAATCDHSLRIPLADDRTEARIAAFFSSRRRGLGVRTASLVAFVLAPAVLAWLALGTRRRTPLDGPEEHVGEHGGHGGRHPARGASGGLVATVAMAADPGAAAGDGRPGETDGAHRHVVHPGEDGDLTHVAPGIRKAPIVVVAVSLALGAWLARDVRRRAARERRRT